MAFDIFIAIYLDTFSTTLFEKVCKVSFEFHFTIISNYKGGFGAIYIW